MRTLTGQLLLAFAIVIVVSGLVTAAVASRTASVEIRHAMHDSMAMHGAMQVEDGLHVMTVPAEMVVGRVNRAVWFAALIAGALAFALALGITRTLTTPLSRLALASQSIAAGDLSARAPLSGPREIGHVATAFNQMAESLGRQEALRQAMLADIAHELRNPLAVMQGQVEALVDGVFPPTRETIEPLHSQVLHLTRLVEELRTLAHADAGHLSLDRIPVPLHPLVSDLLGSAQLEAAAKGVALRSEVPATLPPLDADPVRLRQVLGNLLANALRHTSSGGHITLSAEARERMAHITVEDTGEGISPEDIPHVFDRFYRGDRSRARSTGGAGLGLAIARRLVESHGGMITLSSVRGQGTTVTLTWPLATERVQ